MINDFDNHDDDDDDDDDDDYGDDDDDDHHDLDQYCNYPLWLISALDK